MLITFLNWNSLITLYNHNTILIIIISSYFICVPGISISVSCHGLQTLLYGNKLIFFLSYLQSIPFHIISITVNFLLRDTFPLKTLMNWHGFSVLKFLSNMTELLNSIFIKTASSSLSQTNSRVSQLLSLALSASTLAHSLQCSWNYLHQKVFIMLLCLSS